MTLTDPMRQWLSVPERAQMTTYHVTLDFIRVFRMNPEEAGKALAEWVHEKWERI